MSLTAHDIAGIALMYLRLALQSRALGLSDDSGERLPGYVQLHLPSEHHPHASRPGHVSPLDTHVGPAVIELLRQIHFKASSMSIWESCLKTLRQAVSVAISDDSLGGDDVLYGRAGLLWAMLALRNCFQEGKGDEGHRSDILEIVNDDFIRSMVVKTVDAGQRGADAFEHEYPHEWHVLLRHMGSTSSRPLMWPWHGKIYLGA